MYTELDDLMKRARANREKANNRLKEQYHYARSLGFTSAEAAILMGRTKEYIDRLAQEREVADGKTT